jgi:antitoxin PrlF
MKSTLKITSKGQVTLRKEVLDQLGVRPGDKIVVELIGRGRMEVRPAEPSAKLEDFVGCLKRSKGRSLSNDEIKKIARKGWAGER